jgi:uncharacterized cofD-like protein
MAAVPLDIAATVIGSDPTAPDGVTTVSGQVAVATTKGRVAGISLLPADPPACKEAVAAVRAADWVVLGPGSWFTSVLPHLLVPELLDAIIETKARRLVSLNLAPQAGETAGFSPETHLEVLAAHAPELQLDVVLADRGSVTHREPLERVASALGGELVLADVAADDGTARHDVGRLASAYRTIFTDRGPYERM